MIEVAIEIKAKLYGEDDNKITTVYYNLGLVYYNLE